MPGPSLGICVYDNEAKPYLTCSPCRYMKLLGPSVTGQWSPTDSPISPQNPHTPKTWWSDILPTQILSLRGRIVSHFLMPQWSPPTSSNEPGLISCQSLPQNAVLVPTRLRPSFYLPVWVEMFPPEIWP